EKQEPIPEVQEPKPTQSPIIQQQPQQQSRPIRAVDVISRASRDREREKDNEQYSSIVSSTSTPQQLSKSGIAKSGLARDTYNKDPTDLTSSYDRTDKADKIITEKSATRESRRQSSLVKDKDKETQNLNSTPSKQTEKPTSSSAQKDQQNNSALPEPANNEKMLEALKRRLEEVQAEVARKEREIMEMKSSSFSLPKLEPKEDEGGNGGGMTAEAEDEDNNNDQYINNNNGDFSLLGLGNECEEVNYDHQNEYNQNIYGQQNDHNNYAENERNRFIVQSIMNSFSTLSSSSSAPSFNM
ncbi:MAG: hypothetical protein EZS28_046766, partial [Streblomastix strix]